MAESRDMVTIHRVFRRELALLPALVRAVVDGDRHRVRVLADHTRLTVDVSHHHHEGEDLLLWPRLRDRAPEAAAVLERMDADHADLTRRLAEVEERLTRWEESADPEDADRLAEAVESFGPRLVEHLDDEERDVLPLVDVHLTQEEWGELGARAFSLLAPDDALTVLGAMAEDSPAEEWDWFLPHLPPPVQEAHLAHAQGYRDYVTSVRGSEPGRVC